MRFRQFGVTLLELILVIGLMAVGTILALNERQADLEIQKARVVGNYFFQYNNAARSWLSNNIGASGAQKIGTAWLKSTSCVGGLSAVAYLPCDFPELTTLKPLGFGEISISTTVVSVGAPPNLTTTLTTQTSPFKLAGSLRSDLSAVAAITAAAGMYDTRTPVSAATNGSFQSEPDTAIVTMVASNNGSEDAWLRTDGSNTMNNNLTFSSDSPQSMRIIRNLSRIESLAAQALYLGVAGGANETTAAQVIVDADQTILGKLMVQSVKGGDGILVNQGNIRAANGDVIAKNIQSTSNVLAGGGVYAQGSVGSQVDVTANGAMSAQIYYDANNTSFYVDPSNSTYLNGLVLAGRGTFNEFLQVNGIAIKNTPCPSNGLVARTSTGKLLSCDAGLWVDPSAASSCKMDDPVGLQGWRIGGCSVSGASYAGATQPIGGTRIVSDSRGAEYRQICRSDGAWNVVDSAIENGAKNYSGFDLSVCGSN